MNKKSMSDRDNVELYILPDDEGNCWLTLLWS